MSTESHPTIRIFISSPNDVKAEREKAQEVIDDLQAEFGERARLEAVLWEQLPLPATASFQEGIEVILGKQPIDIAVFVLWSRLGTPLGPRVTRENGLEYRSGTEREFDLMLAAYQQSGRVRPHIMAYIREDDSWRRRLASSPKGDLDDILAQQKLAEQFIACNFLDKQKRNVRAYHSYPEPISFAQHLEVHLRRKLDELLAVEGGAPAWKGPPYRGLQVFDRQHAPIFRGREVESLKVMQLLREQLTATNQAITVGSMDSGVADIAADDAESSVPGRPCAFVLIVGASGSGKSSLARAGVAARLERRSYDGCLWRTATLLPGLCRSDVCGGLAKALLEAVPELAATSASATELADGLRKDPRLTVQVALNPAMAAASKAISTKSDASAEPRPDALRVLLVIDQLEDLWTDREIDELARTRFLAALEAVTQSGRVAAVATLRGDFYPQTQAALQLLKGERGHCDLLAPGAAALRRMITEPAHLAGVRFGRDSQSQQTLDQRLIDDALRDPTALPLLQYALDELHRRSVQASSDSGVLTHAAYDALGGIEGALGKRAAEEFGKLPDDVQATLDEVLPLLITVQTEGDRAVSKRWAPLAELQATPSRRQLTEALIAARFLTTDKQTPRLVGRPESSATDQPPEAREIPVAALANEALLKKWERVQKWVDQNETELSLRTRVEQSLQQWHDADNDPGFLLAPGLPLAEGRQLLQTAPHLLNATTREYIRASMAHHRKLARRRRLTAAGLLTLVGGLLFGVWYWAAARSLVDRMMELNPDRLSEVRSQLGFFRWAADPYLNREVEAAASASGESAAAARERRLRAQIALVQRRPTYAAELLDAIRDPAWSYDFLEPLATALQAAGIDLGTDLSRTLRDSQQPEKVRFRAGLALALAERDSASWREQDLRFLARQLVNELSESQPTLRDYIASVGGQAPLLDELRTVFDDESLPDNQRTHAAAALAQFAANEAQLLGKLLLDCTPGQYATLFPAFQRIADEEEFAQLKAKVRELPPEGLAWERRIELGKQRADAAITLLRLQHDQVEAIFDVFRVEEDPESLTQFVHRCRARGVTPAELMELLEVVDQRRGPRVGDRQKIDDSVMYALLLALGEFVWDDLPPTRETLVERLSLIYERDPSSGVHSACGWLLRRWGQREAVDRVDQTPLPYDPTGHREWFVREIEYESGGIAVLTETRRLYLTFIVFQPAEFTMGSPEEEPNHQPDETQHLVTLTRLIAVCDRELTWSQWMAREGTGRRDDYARQFSKTLRDNDPVFGVSWFDSVAYCRWLSERAGLSEDEQCYRHPSSLPKDGEGNPTNWPLRLEGAGFRLPTDAEWEFICRSGTGTAYSFGHDEQLLDRYAWYLKSSGDWSHPTGELRPNPRGLFDIHGNVFEWCHDWYNEGELSDARDPLGPKRGSNRVSRGGSWSSPAGSCRSSYRGYRGEPTYRYDVLGFRVASVPSSRGPEAQEQGSGADSAGR